MRRRAARGPAKPFGSSDSLAPSSVPMAPDPVSTAASTHPATQRSRPAGQRAHPGDLLPVTAHPAVPRPPGGSAGEPR